MEEEEGSGHDWNDDDDDDDYDDSYGFSDGGITESTPEIRKEIEEEYNRQRNRNKVDNNDIDFGDYIYDDENKILNGGSRTLSRSIMSLLLFSSILMVYTQHI